jgi:hypothetical protein
VQRGPSPCPAPPRAPPAERAQLTRRPPPEYQRVAVGHAVGVHLCACAHTQIHRYRHI